MHVLATVRPSVGGTQQLLGAAIEGDHATVKLMRRDVVVFRGRSNENILTQTFKLAKVPGSWVITQIGQ